MPDNGRFGGLGSVSPRVVSAVVLAVVMAIEFVGPERYAGVHEDVVIGGILLVFVVWLLAQRGSGTGVETDLDSPPAVGEHYRATGAGAPPGVYRVVGAGETVALLRVTDAEGRRANTGEVRRVDRSVVDAEFEPAADPDAEFSLSRRVRDQLSGMYWSVRRFL
jgi:hypothetical protein